MRIHVGKAEVKATREMLVKPFYEDFHDFFIEENYVPSSSDTDFKEILYSEYENQKGIKEIWVWWRLSQNDPNGMMTFVIDCDLHCVGLSETEIMHNGKRKKMQKGKFEVILRAKLDVDDSKWKDGGIFDFLFDFYKKRHMKKLIEAKRTEVLKDLYKFADHAKAYFKLPTHGKVHEPFIPRLGYDDSNHGSPQ